MRREVENVDAPFLHIYQIATENDKYGIIDNNGNIVVDYIFDYIEWHIEEELVEFRKNDKYAICHVSDLKNF